MIKCKLLAMPLAALCLVACQKTEFIEGDGEHVVTFTTQAEETRASVADLSSRCSFAIFHDGERVRTTEHQEKGIDDNYGSYSLRLDKGAYELVVIAHNGYSNCTITSTEKVTFRNSHITDTFYAYVPFTVGDDDVEVEAALSRAVARIQVHSTSQNPADVSQLRFYYRGGSSTLNPKTGQGCVQSRQSETMDISESQDYTLYTFPYQSSTSTLTMTIYSQNDDGEELDESSYTGIPVELNRTTNLTLSLFDKHGINVTIPDEDIQWGENINVSL